ncbi:hypothetical protein BS78_07G212000 [Paspalum vaginatum]|nr:hypothetical protein BS78_07G212000 [Paspalum vaginatum]
MSKMLSFVDAIVASNANSTIQKILLRDSGFLLLPYEEIIGTLLRVRAALSSASASSSANLQLRFHCPPSEEGERILNLIASLLSAMEDKTGEAIWSTMELVRMELTAGVTAWSSSLAPQGSSAVHEATRYVMGYIGFLLSHYSSMGPIVSQAEILGRYVPRTRQYPLLISLIMEMVSSVEQDLAKNSESFQDQSLRFLFLINNSNFIMQQLRDTLSSLDDGDEAAPVADKVEGYMESYVQVSWAPVLSCLLNPPTPRLGRNYHPLSKFESEFHKIYTTQKLWKVPDPALRKRLRRAITEKIIPDYTKYIEDNNVSAPKFTPQQLEEMLQELFEG